MFLALCFQMPGPLGNMFWIRKCINNAVLYLTICKMSISNIPPAFISLIKKWGLAGKSSCFQVYENINESRIRTNIDFIFLFCFSILLSLSFLNPKKSFILNYSFNYWYLKKKNPDNQKQLKLEFKKIEEERNFCSDNFCQRKSLCPKLGEDLEMDIHFSENGNFYLNNYCYKFWWNW